jgi:hypothetical protein
MLPRTFEFASKPRNDRINRREIAATITAATVRPFLARLSQHRMGLFGRIVGAWHSQDYCYRRRRNPNREWEAIEKGYLKFERRMKKS